MDTEDAEKIKKLEKLLRGTIKSWAYLVSFTILGGLLALGVTGVRYERITEYNQFFLKETNKLPTKQDTIDFYNAHNLQDYIINGNPVPLPYKEIKRIVKGEK